MLLTAFFRIPAEDEAEEALLAMVVCHTKDLLIFRFYSTSAHMHLFCSSWFNQVV